MINTKDHLIQDMKIWFTNDLLTKESAHIEGVPDGIMFSLTYPVTPKKIYTVRLRISDNTLEDMQTGQLYSILPYMRVLLMELRKNKDPGLYSVELSNDVGASRSQ